MDKIFEDDPHLFQKTCCLVSKRKVGKSYWLEFDELLFHPQGGGQPADKGFVELDGGEVPIKGLHKERGLVFVVVSPTNEKVEAALDSIDMGDEINCRVDEQFRVRAMRLHTAAHLIMAILKSKIPSFDPKGISISDDLKSVVLKFEGSQFSYSDLELDGAIKHAVNSNAVVKSERFDNLTEAKLSGPNIFRADSELNLRGPVRMVRIAGIDLNPCGGTHVSTLKEIGQVTILSTQTDDLGLCTLTATVD